MQPPGREAGGLGNAGDGRPQAGTGTQTHRDPRDELHRQGEEVRRQYDQAREQARRTKQEISDEVRRRARETGRQVQEGVHDLSRQMTERGQALAERQKEWAAEELAHISAAVRRAASHLHDEGDDAVARYADAAADQVDGAADYLREHGVSGIYRDVQAMVRRRPEIFLGGLFIAGLAMARFLKASAEAEAAASQVDEQEWEGDFSPEAAKGSMPGGSCTVPSMPGSLPASQQPGSVGMAGAPSIEHPGPDDDAELGRGTFPPGPGAGAGSVGGSGSSGGELGHPHRPGPASGNPAPTQPDHNL